MVPKTSRPEDGSDELPPTPQKNKKARTVYPEYTQADVDRLPQDMLRHLVETPIQPEYAVPALLHFLHDHTGAIVHNVNGERLDAILRDERFMECWKKRREEGRMVEIMNNPIIRAEKKPVANPGTQYLPPDIGAAEKAWNAEYVGTAAKVLFETMGRRMRSWGQPYAHFAAFTQSSGTGKSRAVDELAKEVFCIPVRVGVTAGHAYPPQDLDCANWLLQHVHVSQDSFQKAVQAWLYATFHEARTVLQETILPRVRSPFGPDRVKEIARMFKDEMNKDMKYGEHGEFRKRFYGDVKKRAECIFETCNVLPLRNRCPTREVAVQAEDGASDHIETVYDAAKAFVELLYTHVDDVEGFKFQEPLVILCFDEAHELTTSETDRGIYIWTRFEELRRACSIFVGLPIFTLFVSTVGKVELEPFAPLLGQSSSSRLAPWVFTTHAPIVAMPLDVLAERFPLSSEDPWTLGRAASTHHMAHLGRPLFAAMYNRGSLEFQRQVVAYALRRLLGLHQGEGPWNKVLSDVQKLALIAVRLPFGFRACSLTPVEDEWTLVSAHLRLLLHADVGFAGAVTASASEPLLAEASCSYSIFHRWHGGKAASGPVGRFDVYGVLAEQVWRMQVDVGMRGEMLGAMITLDARDRAASLYTGRTVRSMDLGEDGAGRLTAVVEFLRALIPEEYHESCLDGLPAAHLEDEENTMLRNAFAEGWTYFNHYVKVVSFEDVSQEMLLLALTRGAAFVCADGQDEFDLVIPVLMGDKLEKSKVTAIFIRVNTSSRFVRKLHAPLFACIDPRGGERPFFPKGVETPPPIIRMVFALAAPSEQSSVSVRKQPKRSESRPPNKPGFTAYDLWFSGASRKSFGVIQSGDEERSIETILSVMRRGRDVVSSDYDAQWVGATIRQMQPLASVEADYMENWVDYGPDDGGSARAKDREGEEGSDSEDEDEGEEDSGSEDGDEQDR